MASSQTVLITGCSTGIGRALARELRCRGHEVYATARKREALLDLDPPAHALALDVTSRESIHGAVASVMAQAGRIDVLINNAGINVIGPLAEMPIEDLRNLFETNVTGSMAMTQAVFPHMAARGSGRIVNIGSIVHLLATPFGGAYAASKAAVHLLSEALRMEVAPFGIDVIEVQPGGVRSSLAATAAVGLERYQAPSSLYRAAYEGIVRRARASQEGPMDADLFAVRVADAILASSPPRVVRAGTGSGAIPLLASLPRAALQAALTRRFGLSAIRSSLTPRAE